MRLLYKQMNKTPPKDAIREALSHPNGWVDEINGIFKKDEETPARQLKVPGK